MLAKQALVQRLVDRKLQQAVDAGDAGIPAGTGEADQAIDRRRTVGASAVICSCGLGVTP